MGIISSLKANGPALAVATVVGLVTANTLKPLPHPIAEAAAQYAPHLAVGLVGVGFLALRMQHQFVMLVCFLSSISLCDLVHKNEVRARLQPASFNNIAQPKPAATPDSHYHLTSHRLFHEVALEKANK